MPRCSQLQAGKRLLDTLSRRVRSEITQRSLLPKGCRILVAVSGGQDSLALAELLRSMQQAAKQWAYLGLAHTDHKWPADEGCSRHVAAYAQNVDLPLHIIEHNGSSLSQSEASAREWRYAALADLARQHSITHVAVGHTLSDLAETLLFNLFHGAGADGLSSMTWIRDLHEERERHAHPVISVTTAPYAVKLVRPLLSVSRSETEALCRDRNLAVWKDPYNNEPRYARFHTREHVLPYLRAHYNVHVEEALARTAHLLRDEALALEQYAQDVFDRAVRTSRFSPHVRNALQVFIDTAVLERCSVALQRRVLRRVLTQYVGTNKRTSLFDHVEQLRKLITSADNCNLPSLPGGAFARRSGQDIEIRIPSQAEVSGAVPAEAAQKNLALVQSAYGNAGDLRLDAQLPITHTSEQISINLQGNLGKSSSMY